jgi:LysM repeat protein
VAVDIKGLLKDKKAQAALAGGAVLGLVVLARSRGASGASDTEASTSTAGTATGGGGAAGGGYLGGYDSTASDVYNNLQTSLDNRLDGFGSSITDLQDQLKKLQQKPVPPKPPGKIAPPKKPVKPPTKKTPVKRKPPAAKTQTITIRSGDTLSGLARRYGTSIGNLQRLNGIRNPNSIRAGAKLRVR